MIMCNRRNAFYEETAWERWINDTKLLVYAVLHDLITMNFISTVVFKLFILIESIQLLYFSINKNFNFLWDTEFFI